MTFYYMLIWYMHVILSHFIFLLSMLRPRALGQLVRARNIKTVGDLSALTPSEIKLLPIRSPTLSNVKKALKLYHEQQVQEQKIRSC